MDTRYRGFSSDGKSSGKNNEKTAENRGKNYIISLTACVMIIAFVFIIILRVKIIPKNDNVFANCDKASVKAGVAEITLLGDNDVATVESKIEALNRMQNIDQIKNGDIKIIFEKSMIMGDSHMEGISVYGLLDESHVAAAKGRSILNCSGEINKTVRMNPSNVFLNYGMNDLQTFQDNQNGFIERYRGVINQLSEQLPSAKIYVCSIFPVEQPAIDKQPYLGKVPEFNEALSKMCADDKRLTFIDTTSLMTEDVYEPDHIHTNSRFHKTWLLYVAGHAGLLDVG